MNEYGDAELESINPEELGDSEVNELARSSSYTWEFVSAAEDGDDAAAGAGSSGGDYAPAGLSGGTDPPETGD
jgi:hypothetical protein